MKVLIVNTYDISGGAARAASRLHQSLTEFGIDSKMFVLKKESFDSNIFESKGFFQKFHFYFRFYFSRIFFLFYKNRNLKQPFSAQINFSNTSFLKIIKEFKPDLIHLHWINDGLLSLHDLQKVNLPIVWTLHDIWPLTGGCHYSGICFKYKIKCEKCYLLNSKFNYDLSNLIFNKKKFYYQRFKSLTIIGLSKWIANCASESYLFKNKEIINLPNCIDVNLFKPIDVNIAREIWNFPKNKKIILFGAMEPTSDERKGYHQLMDAIKKIKTFDFEIVVLGPVKQELLINKNIKTHYVGMLKDDISLITLYSAVDVIVVPSLEENLSNIIMEGMSCDTPVIAFDIGGNSDLIDHKKNGYLAKSLDTTELADGIDWVLSNLNSLKNNPRDKVINTFESGKIANKYNELYNQILNKF